MKREILFRGKRIDSGEWVEGFYTIDTIIREENTYLAHIISAVPEGIYDHKSWEVDPETVGQFTELYDTNSKKIFEGDIITNRYFDNGVVSYYDGAFEVNEDGTCATFHENFDSDRCEVIGNVHDNPEMLAGGENNGSVQR